MNKKILFYSNQTAAKNLDFNKVKRGLQLIVSKTFVNSPQTALELIYAFQKENIWNSFGKSIEENNSNTAFFKACIIEEHYSYCIFASEKSIKLIKENIAPSNRRYLIDGTFSVVPKSCFKQLLIVYIEYFNQVIQNNF